MNWEQWLVFKGSQVNQIQVSLSLSSPLTVADLLDRIYKVIRFFSPAPHRAVTHKSYVEQLENFPLGFDTGGAYHIYVHFPFFLDLLSQTGWSIGSRSS
jgi:hypothetical protein